MTTQWLDDLRLALKAGPAALITVLATEGSAPRGAGTRMVVTQGALFGTIGGGTLELKAIAQARAALDLPLGAWRVQDYPLGPLLGQCCGGRVRLLVEHVDPAQCGWLDKAEEGQILVSTLCDGFVRRDLGVQGVPATLSARGERPGLGAVIAQWVGERRRPVWLFGAGHVGQAIARHARGLPFDLAWFDTRPEQAGLDGVTLLEDAAIEECLAEAPDDAAILILTHDHALDYRLARAALGREATGRAPLAFVGLIGSATKRARFLSRLGADGIDDAARARMTCPIGIPGVPGKEPDVIAIATLAQLLALRTDVMARRMPCTLVSAPALV